MSLISTYAKPVAILLCSIALFSSFGLTIDMHLCQGKVKTFNFLGEAQKCLEMKESDICKPQNSPISISKKDCCTEASIKAETSTQNIPVITNQVQNLVLGMNPYAKLDATIIPKIKSDIFNYKPPPDEQTGRVLLVLHQTFLI